MRKVGFIGKYDKIDLIMYIAKVLTCMGQKVIIIDTTTQQKARYIVPAINPTVSYVTEFEQIDVAVGFENMDNLAEYFGINNINELEYDIAFIDIDTKEELEKFNMQDSEKNYFISTFDVYSLKKGLEIFEEVKKPMKLTKILFSKEMLKEEDDYLNYLSLEYKIIWEDHKIYFPFEEGDQSAIFENQRISKIKFANLTSQYKESISYIVEELNPKASSMEIRRKMRTIEKEE